MSGPARAGGSWAGLAGLALLPTVWSNGIAAAWLAGGVAGGGWDEFRGGLEVPRLLLALAGASLVFTGWAVGRKPFLALPVPEAESVIRWGRALILLVPGGLLMGLAGPLPAVLGLVLIAALAGELAGARAALGGPIFQGLARLALYLAAAAALPEGVNGWVIWGGVVMGVFTAGVGYLARQQELGRPLEFPPWLLLAAPLVLAWVMNNGPYRAPALLLGAVLVLWLARSAHRLLRPREGQPVAARELLPALVLVDWLAMADAPRNSGLLFLPLFALAFVLARLEERRV